MTQANVATPSLAYEEMAKKWDVIEPLREFSAGMREQGQTLLPLASKEEQPQWNYRRDRSFLYPMYDDAICDIVARPFRKDVTLQNAEGLPELLAPMEENIDQQGQTLTAFARDLMDTAIDYGLTHVLVEFSETDVGQTKDQDVLQGVRPFFNHVKPRDLIGWHVVDLKSGAKWLDQCRITTTTTERLNPENPWDETPVKRVHVYQAPTVAEGAPDDLLARFIGAGAEEPLTAEEFEAQGGVLGWRWTYKEDAMKNWVPETDDPISFSYPGIPLVTYYTNRTGFLTADPPLFGLADTNVQHWQIASDFSNIVHVAQVPWLMAMGLPDGTLKRVSFGPNRLFETTESPKDALIKWLELEHGIGIEAGKWLLEKIEDRGRELAMEPEIQKVGAPTATGQGIDEAKSQSRAQSWIGGDENVLLKAYGISARWIRKALPDDFLVKIFSDFTVALRAKDDLDSIDKDLDAGRITTERGLMSKQERGVYPEEMDPAVEAAAAKTEREETPQTEPAPAFGEPELTPEPAGAE